MDIEASAKPSECEQNLQVSVVEIDSRDPETKLMTAVGSLTYHEDSDLTGILNIDGENLKIRGYVPTGNYFKAADSTDPKQGIHYTITASLIAYCTCVPGQPNKNCAPEHPKPVGNPTPITLER